eukprot:scaffold19.g1753.t1
MASRVNELVVQLSLGGQAAAEAACALGRLAANKDANSGAMGGAIPPLVQLLGSSSPEVQGLAAYALGNLTRTPADRKAITAAGAIPPLVGLLGSSSADVQQWAAYALGTLARNPGSRKAAIAEGATRSLVQLLGSRHTGVQKWTAYALGHVGSRTPACREVAAAAGAILPLVRLLSSNSAGVQEMAVFALVKLVCGSPTNREASTTAAAGATQALVKLLGSSSAGVQQMAALALGNVSGDTPADRQAIAAAGVIPALLLGSGNKDVQHGAAVAVVTLASDSHANCTAISAAGGIPPLVRLLDSSSEGVQQCAAGALVNLAQNTPANCGAITAAMEALPADSTNIYVLGNAARQALLAVQRAHEHQKVRTLNSGAHGFVQLCKDRATGAEVAIKFIERGDKINEYVLHEILNHRQLVFPHIIQFSEVFLMPHHLGIVMEYAAGGDLFSHVAAAGGLSEDRARWFFQQFVLAVAYMHSRGVANRDIKLENTLLDDSPVPLLKICDFGYSKSEFMQSAPGTLVGTPAYQAPEVITNTGGQRYDGKNADVWSCGVMLYVMVVGAYPFERPEDDCCPQLRAQRMYQVLQHSAGGAGGPGGGLPLAARCALATRPRAPVRVPPLAQRILALDYSFPPDVDLTPECRDLISHILVSDPAARITIAEIQEHPWFRTDLPPGVSKMMAQTFSPRPGSQSEADIRAVVEEAGRLPGATEVRGWQEEEEEEDIAEFLALDSSVGGDYPSAGFSR